MIGEPPEWDTSQSGMWRVEKRHQPTLEILAAHQGLLGHALYRATVLARRKPANDPAGLLGDFVRYNFLGSPQKA